MADLLPSELQFDPNQPNLARGDIVPIERAGVVRKALVDGALLLPTGNVLTDVGKQVVFGASGYGLGAAASSTWQRITRLLGNYANGSNVVLPSGTYNGYRDFFCYVRMRDGSNNVSDYNIPIYRIAPGERVRSAIHDLTFTWNLPSGGSMRLGTPANHTILEFTLYGRP